MAQKRRLGPMTALVVAISLIAPVAAQASTLRIEPAYTDSHFWTPGASVVASGDLITWSLGANPKGHRLETYAGDGDAFSTPVAPQGDFTRPFSGGTVWYRCPVHSNISVTGICAGMCGSYTDRDPPDLPSITSPKHGEQVDGERIVYRGTAPPLTDLVLFDYHQNYPNGKQMASVFVGGSGTWSVGLDWEFEGALYHGTHTMVAIVRDAGDRHSAQSSVTYTVSDDTPPQITLDGSDPAVLSTPAELWGSLSDDTSVRSIEARLFDAAGRRTAIIPGTCPGGCRQADVTWSIDLASAPFGYHYVLLVAKDIFRNETSRAVRIIRLP